MINNVLWKKLISKTSKYSQIVLVVIYLLSSLRWLTSIKIFQLPFIVEKFFLSSLSCPTFLINWTKIVIVAVYMIVLLVVRPIKWAKYLFVLLIILGLFTGFFYLIILDSRTIKFDDHIYVKGQLTEMAKEHLEKNPPMTEKDYFNRIGRDPNKVWTSESLEKNKLILGVLYSLVVGIIGFGILGVLEIFARSNSAQLQSVSVETAKNQKTNKKKPKEK